MGAAELLDAAGRLTTLTESSGAAAATAWRSHIERRPSRAVGISSGSAEYTGSPMSRRVLLHFAPDLTPIKEWHS